MASNQYGDLRERERTFADKFNEIYAGLFEYHSEFKDVDSSFISTCLACGTKQERSAQCARKAKEIKCKNCIANEKEAAKVRAREVRQAFKVQKALIKALKNKPPDPVEACCILCGCAFLANRKNNIYCSNKCQQKAHIRKKEIRRKGRKLSNGEINDGISIELLYKRDKGTCHICGDTCDFNDYKHVMSSGVNAFVVGGSYPSIDHVLPVCKGGTHQWDNVKLAHHSCNTKKGTKITYEKMDGQVRMFV